jgi:Uncharacterized conserved protein
MIQFVLRKRLKEMCSRRARALDWSDPEGVHDMRVASRRLRSALNDFKPFLRRRSLPLERIKQVGKSLGAVRDEDVALAALEQLESKASESVAAGIEAIAEERRRARLQSRAALEQTISPKAIAALQKDFLAQLQSAAKIPDKASITARVANRVLTFRQVGANVIKDRVKQLSAAGKCVYHPLQTKELHEMRILAKRLRYAVELFASCWGDELKSIAKEIAGLQTSLGGLHDCDVWIANLGARLEKGNRAPSNSATDGRRDREAAVWLLRHFARERNDHYCDALLRWDKWKESEFFTHLKTILESDVSASKRKPILAVGNLQ